MLDHATQAHTQAAAAQGLPNATHKGNRKPLGRPTSHGILVLLSLFQIPYWLQGEDPCVIHGSWLEWWKFVRGGLIDLAKTAIGMHLCVLAAKRYLGPEGKGPLYLLQELLLGGISYWAAKDNYAFYRMMLFGHY